MNDTDVERTSVSGFKFTINALKNLSQKFMMTSPHKGLKIKGWDVVVV
jgi:hypothetical protein